MRIVLVGLSHKTAPVELREKLSLYGSSHEEALHDLRDATGLEECAILSTCNRTEVYGVTREEDWEERLLEHLARRAGFLPGQLQSHLYSWQGEPAVRHLFRVAAGLDSMVVGEGQILAQVKDALQASREAGTVGTLVHTLFQHAISAGKRARTETEIGRGAVSISLAAVQLARQVFGRLDRHVVLLLGAGETAEETARALLAGGEKGTGPRILVCNRTPERAEALASEFSGTAMPFERLGEALVQADIVIASTGAPQAVVSVEQVRKALRARRGNPILLIDIAVPRDIEAAVGELDDIYLFNIDHLQKVVESSLAGRQGEVARVETLIEEDLQKYVAWQRGLEVAPTIQQLQHWAAAVVDSEQSRVGRRLSHLSERDREVVETLVRGVVNKLLRPPILHLKEAAGTGNGYHEVESVRRIFGLEGETDSGEAKEAPAEPEAIREPESREALR